MKKIFYLLAITATLLSASFVANASIAYEISVKDFSVPKNEEVPFKVQLNGVNSEIANGYTIKVESVTTGQTLASSANVNQINNGFGSIYSYRILNTLPVDYYFITIYDDKNTFVDSADFEVVDVVVAEEEPAADEPVLTPTVEESKYSFSTQKTNYNLGEKVVFTILNGNATATKITENMRFNGMNHTDGSVFLDNSSFSYSANSGYKSNVPLTLGDYILDLMVGNTTVATLHFSVVDPNAVQAVAQAAQAEAEEEMFYQIVGSKNSYVTGEKIKFALTNSDSNRVLLRDGMTFSGGNLNNGAIVFETGDFVYEGGNYNYSLSQNLPAGPYVIDFKWQGDIVFSFYFDVVAGEVVDAEQNANNAEAEPVREDVLQGQAAANGGANGGNSSAGSGSAASSSSASSTGSSAGSSAQPATQMREAVVIEDANMNFEAREDFCSDVDDSFWGRVIVQELINAGEFPLEPTEDGFNCRVGREMTRGEFTAWLMIVFYQDDLLDPATIDYAELGLEDIDGEGAFDQYIALAAELGIINGYPDGMFRPEKTINRAEVLKVLLRSSGVFTDTAEELASLKLMYLENQPLTKFVDLDDEESWYYGYLYFAMNQYNENLQSFLIEGRVTDGNLREAAMGDIILFGEAAKLLYMMR